jgi:hypothetical protein
MTTMKQVVVGASIIGIAIVLAPVAVNAAITGTVVKTGTGSVTCSSGYRVSGGGFSIPANSYSNNFSTEYVILSSKASSTTSWSATGLVIRGSYSTSSGWRYSKSNYSPAVSAVCIK